MKTRTTWCLVAVLLASLFLVACAARSHVARAEQRVHHIVLMWLNEPSSKEAREKLISASLSYRSVPGVIDVVVGNALASERPMVDHSFDLGIVMVFRDKEALEDYVNTPAHQQATAAILRPLVKKVVIYDIVESVTP